MKLTKEQQIKQKILIKAGMRKKTIKKYFLGTWIIPKQIQELLDVRSTE